MKIQMIAIDLDGTLLTGAKSLSPATVEAVARARRAGVRIVIASARPPRTTMPFYSAMGLDTPLINYNGAMVHVPASGRLILHSPIPEKSAWQILKAAREVFPEVRVSAEILDKWYTDCLDAAYQTETARLVQPDMIAPADRWLNRSVTKMLLLGPPGRLADVGLAVKHRLKHHVRILKTEDYLLQIMHSSVSKARAVHAVASEMRIGQDEVMAIGDNANDVDMLQWAGIGVAMKNATNEAVAAADFVTGTNDSDGAAKAINAMLDGKFPSEF
ncbi:MAG: HAD family phosphatase [Planctomycetes bacterium]|nr:HAD family phosphatase [Planctomycetota bacterium]